MRVSLLIDDSVDWRGARGTFFPEGSCLPLANLETRSPQNMHGHTKWLRAWERKSPQETDTTRRDFATCRYVQYDVQCFTFGPASAKWLIYIYI